MLTVISYSSLDLVWEYIFKYKKLDFLNYLSDTAPNYRLKVLDEIEQIPVLELNTEELFESSESQDKEQMLIFKILNISFSSSEKEMMQFLQQMEAEIFLVFDSETKFPSIIKNFFNDHKISFIELKTPSKETMQEILEKYLDSTDLNLNLAEKNKLIAYSSNYFELINKLDFLLLSENHPEAKDQIFTSPEVPEFMLSFNPDEISREIFKWYPKIYEENISFLISILFTKLSKFNGERSKKMQKNLIKIDFLMKKASKISNTTWLKLWLFFCLKL